MNLTSILSYYTKAWNKTKLYQLFFFHFFILPFVHKKIFISVIRNIKILKISYLLFIF
ncbi:hypothetical protein HMPREF1987_01332 [Peptostreptococcaceae bacterium oral taxon 113 str. W5053]|nr:hypothetical protein HMPREF1987_01332 [Peptostreptococcaceae bacterium oral taxon 113 str. W5053]